jgi:large subunit ribosomal protein L31e
MAEKKEETKIVLERIYNVPLRKKWLKVPRYTRAKKAASALRQFLARHMKTDIENVKIGRWANEKLWERSIKNPPHHIRVKVQKDDKGIVRAELIELSARAKIIDEKEKKMKEETEKKKKVEKKEEVKKEEKAGEKKEEKKEEKAETKAEAEVKKEEKEVMQKTDAKPAMHEHEHKIAPKHEPLHHPHRVTLQK